MMMVCTAYLTREIVLKFLLGARVSFSLENGGMVDESIGAVAILVSLTGELDRDVTVRIETLDGTGTYAFITDLNV